MKSIRQTFLSLTTLVLFSCATPDENAQAGAPAPVGQNSKEQAAVTRIKPLGGRVLYIAKDAKEYSVTITKDSFGKTKGFTVAEAKLLGELDNAVEISLQHPDADDAWVASLKGLNGLKKLHLEKTKITDQALDTIGGLSSLEYLNLYGTGVSDAGLDKLNNLKKLKSLYLWQTKVTEAKA